MRFVRCSGVEASSIHRLVSTRDLVDGIAGAPGCYIAHAAVPRHVALAVCGPKGPDSRDPLLTGVCQFSAKSVPPAGPADVRTSAGLDAAFRTAAILLYNNPYSQFHDRTCFTIERRKVVDKFGRVAEWLMAADCKSAAPCGLRRFESSPVHQQSWIDF